MGSVCHVLTLGQRCADWFIPWQFRVTGTNAGILLIPNYRVRSERSVKGDGNEGTLGQLFPVLQAGWFSSKISTEVMKMGTLNEPAVLNALQRFDSIKAVFDIDMLVMKKNLHSLLARWNFICGHC